MSELIEVIPCGTYRWYSQNYEFCVPVFQQLWWGKTSDGQTGFFWKDCDAN